jgi:hypothetical protein
MARVCRELGLSKDALAETIVQGQLGSTERRRSRTCPAWGCQRLTGFEDGAETL